MQDIKRTNVTTNMTVLEDIEGQLLKCIEESKSNLLEHILRQNILVENVTADEIKGERRRKGG